MKVHLHSLGLACSCWTSWCPTVAHVERLCKSDVTAIGERCDHQTLRTAEKLILVLKVHIGNGNDTHGVLLHEVDSRLLEPIEIVLAVNALLYLGGGNVRRDSTQNVSGVVI